MLVMPFNDNFNKETNSKPSTMRSATAVSIHLMQYQRKKQKRIAFMLMEQYGRNNVNCILSTHFLR